MNGGAKGANRLCDVRSMEGLGVCCTKRPAHQRPAVRYWTKPEPPIGGDGGRIGRADLHVQRSAATTPTLLYERVQQPGCNLLAPKLRRHVEIIDIAAQRGVLHGVAHRKHSVANSAGIDACQPDATEVW